MTKKHLKLNRLTEVLKEQNKSQVWLASVLNKNTMTINNWCKNRSQPNLKILFEISDILMVNINDLISKPGE